MNTPRRTFVLTVHGDERDTVLEDVGTRERVRLSSLALLPRQIARWLREPMPAHEPEQGD